MEATFAEGVRLFNSGAFWHAHEQWEDCWRQAHEPEATLLKGLIQAAAALVHWQRGNPKGLWRNWYKARPRLVAVTHLQGTLSITSFIAQMDQFVVTHTRYNPDDDDLAPTLSFR